MDDIEKIKKKFVQRKKESSKGGKNNKKASFYKITMSIIILYSFFMGFAIYAKKDVNALYLNSILNTDFNFKQFNESINDLLDLRIVEQNKNKDEVVNGSINYVELGDDYYMSDGNLVVSLDDGVVSYVNGKDDNYTVIVEYDNGIMATYYNLIEVNVFSNDRVYSSDIIGSYNEKVKVVFIKDNVKIAYEDVISSR